MGEMPSNPIQLLGAALVVTFGLAATSGAASALAKGSRFAADAAQVEAKIAFITRGPQRVNRLYVVSADGSGQWRLTGNVLGRTGRTPAWSPDGRRIAFESVGDGTIGISAVNADGSGQRRLARNGGAPAWSPDGRTIAFFSGRRVYVMNADGSEHRALTRRAAGRERSLAWSPDGRKLAFLSDEGGCGQFCFNLYVMNSDGSGLRNLTRKLTGYRVGPGGELASDPAWSPDGKKIAFVRLNGSLRDPIYVVNADGSGLRNLTPKPVGAYATPPGRPTGGSSPSSATATATPRSTL